jgi:hypothetical protein
MHAREEIWGFSDFLKHSAVVMLVQMDGKTCVEAIGGSCNFAIWNATTIDVNISIPSNKQQQSTLRTVLPSQLRQCIQSELSLIALSRNTRVCLQLVKFIRSSCTILSVSCNDALY